MTWDVGLLPGANRFHAVGASNGAAVSDRAEAFYFDPGDKNFIAINAGSNTEMTDAGGVVWQADRPVDGAKWRTIEGTSKPAETLANVLGTLDDPLFQTMREGVFGYTFDVPDGEYEVDLRFIERKHKAAGLRVFRVSLNGDDPFAPIDLFADAGFMQQVSRKMRVAAEGGRGIEVRFEAITDLPVLSGISVKRIS
jgi:beta-galactosidase